MRARLLLIVAVVIFTALSAAAWSIKNPVVKNPVGTGTVPPSSTYRGLARSPNPIDTGGNLVITGNVVGGKHFRGIVPYHATSSFWAGTGSSSLDSFLRRSASPGRAGRYTGRYTPYYSPSGTVTTTRPGSSAVFRPPTVRLDGRVASGFALPPLPKRQGIYGVDTAVSYGRFRPMSMTLQEMEKVISSGVSKYPQGGKLSAEQRQARTEQFQRDLKQVGEEVAELKQGLISQDDFSWLSTIKKPSGNVPERFETPMPKEQPPPATSGGQQPDIYEQMKQQIDKFQKDFEGPRKAGTLERLLAAKQAKEATNGEKKPSDEKSHLQLTGWQTQKSAFVVGSRKAGSPTIGRKTGGQGRSQAESSRVDWLWDPAWREPSDIDLSVSPMDSLRRAKGILGFPCKGLKTFASFSSDKFNEHLRAGEDYLKQGKYYLAADAYTLASIYKPGDPLAYAGKSHALFAAGEYMSSALFLSRALEIFPEYGGFAIDLVAMVGDRDKLESRIADVEQWLKISDAGELQFLLGYVYYQIGRLERAKKAIDAAYEKMPVSSAVAALKKAIDDAILSGFPSTN